MYIKKLLIETQKLLISGEIEEAMINYKKILKLDIKNIIAHNNLAYLYFLKKDYRKGIISSNSALKIKSNHIDALNNKGNCLKGLHKYNDALRCYEDALQIKPNFVNSLYNKANCLQALNKYQEALECYNQVLKLKPNFINAINNKGNCFEKLDQYEEALKAYHKALKIKPDFLESIYNSANCLKKLNKYNDALKYYDQAVKIKPDFVEAINNKANCLYELCQLDEAIKTYENAIKIKPDFAYAKWNMSRIQLLKGNYKDGWKNYEWRKKCLSDNKYLTFGKDKEWLGNKSLKNKILYISKEQGLGDYIQFCRYLPILNEMGAKLILDTPKPLRSMIDTMNLNYTHTDDLSKLDFDYHCCIASLPLAFNTSLETIPCQIPYLITPKKIKDFWTKKFKENKKIKIGIKWSGSKKYALNKERSISLEKLKPIFKLPYDFHSLQIEYENDDEKLMKTIPNIFCHKDEIRGLDKTAGLIETMDLIISVDTGIVQLCGAIGKPFWNLLSLVPDFRWLLNRQDSPWFPSAKLYRQTKKNDWETVIKQVAVDLADLKLS